MQAQKRDTILRSRLLKIDAVWLAQQIEPQVTPDYVLDARLAHGLNGRRRTRSLRPYAGEYLLDQQQMAGKFQHIAPRREETGPHHAVKALKADGWQSVGIGGPGLGRGH